MRRRSSASPGRDGEAAPAAEGSLTQSVERALSILSLFTDKRPALRVADVSAALGLGQSTSSRLLATLEALGYVTKDPQTGHYRLGAEVIRLGGVALNNNELRRQALGVLHEVSSATGLGANLSVLRRYGPVDWGIFYLAHFDGAKAPRTYTLVGRRNPLHATGMGKVLLAHLPERERQALLDALPLPAYTPRTLTSHEALEAELEAVRDRGYAVEREELAFGRACVAAPIRDRTGQVVAAMSLSGPLSAMRLEQREAELAQLTIEHADGISQQLGYVSAPAALLIAAG
ncbi:MAG: IclR family transcriptional regulator [Chloroflexi bacterium]|nr:IclR family transcriptional regulator [Chloroflexota bacterium]